MPRDNFNAKTKDILAKRVGFICSNPNCRKHTIGPNSNPEKATLIGEAAHITAASLNGPRYDATLDELQRQSILNGIWLCSNCADLIDKDEQLYPVELLKSWRDTAEKEMQMKIGGLVESKVKPFIDIDLIWHLGGRSPNGYSPLNEYEYIEEEKAYLLKTDPPIIFWRIFWNFKLVIYNNSNQPIFNIKIEELNNQKFDFLTHPPVKNNLPPLQNIDLEAKSYQQIEGTYLEADELLNQKVPSHLEGLKLRVKYQDETQHHFSDVFKIINSEFVKE